MDWDTVKENLKPAVQGRKPAALAAALEVMEACPRSDGARKIEDERRILKERILAYSGDDPLAPWLGLIKWTEKNFPNDGPASEKLRILEDCTRRFANEPLYRHDSRFLRVWLKYADMCREPMEIFQFLQKKDIGQKYSLFYEAFSTFLELRGRYTEAMNVFQKGITNAAQPETRLKLKFEDFQRRMVGRIQRQQRRMANNDDQGNLRSNLGRLEQAGQVNPRAQTHLTQRGGRGSRTTQNSKPESQSRSNPLQVYDESLQDSLPSESLKHPADATWSQLPTQAELRRENELKPSTWNNARLPQRSALRGGRARSTTDQLQVFDDSLDAQESQHKQPHHHEDQSIAVNGVSNPITTDESKIDQAHADQPPEEPKEASTAPGKQKSAQDSHTRENKHEEQHSSKSAKNKTELAFDAAILEYGGEEFCFEESRARCQKYAVHTPAVVETASKVAAGESTPSQCLSMDLDSEELLLESTKSLKKSQSFQEPTINTKIAQADIMSMFNEPLEMDKVKSSQKPRYGKQEAGNALSIFDDFEPSATNKEPKSHGSLQVFEDTKEDENDENMVPKKAKVADDVGGEDVMNMNMNTDKQPSVLHGAENTRQPDLITFTPRMEKKMDVKFPHMENVDPHPNSEYATLSRPRSVITEDMEKAVLQPLDIVAEREDDIIIPAEDDYDESRSDGRTDVPVASEHKNDSPAVSAQVVSEMTWQEPVAEASSEEDSGPDRGLKLELGPIMSIGRAAAASDQLLSEYESSGSHNVIEPSKQHAPLLAEAKTFLQTPNIDPFSRAVYESCLALANPPLRALTGLCDSRSEAFGKISGLRVVKEKQGKQKAAKVRGGQIQRVGMSTFLVKGCVGEGSYAEVYLGYEISEEQTMAANGWGLENEDNALALKVQRPAAPWEFFISNRLHSAIRLLQPNNASFHKYFISADRCVIYADCTVTISPYYAHGTLQNVVNGYLRNGESMPEVVAMFYTLELLTMLERMHSCKIIHADIKPDNLLIRDDFDGQWTDWQPDSDGCWGHIGLTLCDFGRAIDLDSFERAGVSLNELNFTGSKAADTFKSIQMTQDKPWSYHVDLFATAGVIHTLLFSDYLKDLVFDENGRAKPGSQFKRYWAIPIWTKVFDFLINWDGNGCSVCPDFSEIKEMMTDFLRTKGKTLRLGMMKQKIMMAKL